MSGFGVCDGFGEGGIGEGGFGDGCTCEGVTYDPRVVFGDLDLTDPDGPFDLEYGYKLGNGVTVYDELSALLRDGTLVSSSRTGNRQLDLSVLIKSTTGSQALADSGVLLDVECNKDINTVTVYPGDYGHTGAGPALTLDTFIAQSDHDPDGDLERAGYRRFLLTIPALPGVRSVEESVINWTGPAEELRDTNSTTGWTSRPGGGTLSASASGLSRTDPGDLKLTTVPTNPLRKFIYIRGIGGAGAPTTLDMVIGGVAIPEAEVYKGPTANDADLMLVEVPEEFVGTTPQIDFDIEVSGGAAVLYSFWTTNYPNIPPGGEPGGIGLSSLQGLSANFGLDHIVPGGTARTGCTIMFTAPTGGAFVLTERNPVQALRGRGLSEMVFGRFTWAAEGAITIGGAPFWFPPGTHYAQIGRTLPRPPQLNPNGLWPTQAMGAKTIGTDAATATRWTYPADELAAVSFFNTTGVKNVISAGPDLRDGYQGDAVVFEEHLLHPDGTGFAVLDINGAPIAATVTYYRRWLHYPAA